MVIIHCGSLLFFFFGPEDISRLLPIYYTALPAYPLAIIGLKVNDTHGNFIGGPNGIAVILGGIIWLGIYWLFSGWLGKNN